MLKTLWNRLFKKDQGVEVVFNFNGPSISRREAENLVVTALKDARKKGRI